MAIGAGLVDLDVGEDSLRRWEEGERKREKIIRQLDGECIDGYDFYLASLGSQPDSSFYGHDPARDFALRNTPVRELVWFNLSEKYAVIAAGGELYGLNGKDKVAMATHFVRDCAERFDGAY